MNQKEKNIVKYPESFLSRPCDRRFLALVGDRVQGALCAYRIWADYSIGSSDRRRLSEPLDGGKVSCSDREVLIMEEFCDWDGARGGLVRAAVDSGFLTLVEAGGGVDLVCTGFYPLNSKSALSMQQKGAYANAVSRANKKADKTSAEQMDIFERNGHEVSKVELSDGQKREAIKLVQILGRVMRLKELASSDWRASLVEEASAVCGKYLVAEREMVFRWLMMHRADAEIPKRVDLILKNFADYMERARAAG